MKLLYEQEIRPHLTQSFEEIAQYAKELVDSNNSINWQKVNELSYLLRRNNRHNEAVEVSRLMYEKVSTADRLNLYFVAVVDQGNNDKIWKLHGIVDEFVKQNGYQKHLFATWLKAANRIQDDEIFNYVYGMVPSSEKTENSYIISQYYVYLNRHSLYNDVVSHYENELAGKENVQNFEFVKKYYNNARAHLGYGSAAKPANEGYRSPSVPAVIMSDASMPDVNRNGQEEAQDEQRVFLVYGKNPVELQFIKFLLQANHIAYTDLSNEAAGNTIIAKFEEFAQKSKFVIVLMTPEDEVKQKKSDGSEKTVYYARPNVILEMGYFWGKITKENIAVLVQDQIYKIGDDFILPSDLGGLEYISLSKGSWISKLVAMLKKSGFNIDIGIAQ